MKFILEAILAFFLRLSLWFRYRITVKGLDKLTPENLKRPGGVLFLPTHPTVYVDAVSVSLALWPKFRLRHMIVEYMYNLPVVNAVMRFLNALPVPDFSTSSNSLKRKRNEQVTQEVINGLKRNEHFLIFPAGRCKQTGYEAVDGASAVHRIVQDTPEANIVLVRVKGLWGSSFSRALLGRTPPFFPTILNGVKHVLKNLIFFTPRREVIIEFEPVGEDFPYKAGRLEFNRYLEQWYNKPDGLQKATLSGDSLILVSYSMWKEELPEVWQSKDLPTENLQPIVIPESVKNKVIAKIVELTHTDPSGIQPQMSITTDLGMDSLDVAELIAFLQDQFDVTGVTPDDLTSVARLMAIAARQVTTGEGTIEECDQDVSRWIHPLPTHARAYLPEGKTLGELFLKSCDQRKKFAACADLRSGVVTFSQFKLRAIILAEMIKKLPGDYIGIMLPASAAATLCMMACQIAGKIPLMINWTVGNRHLQAVAQLTKVQAVLSSWSFIDRLQNVDLTGIEDQLVMLEDVRREIKLSTKLKAFLLSKSSPETILKHFGSNKIKETDTAVLLFTSGTEGMPKGVPLSHKNLISNQRASLESIAVYQDDVILGILPPFHSFGFTISSSIGILAGVRTAFSPDPTDGMRLAKAFEKWSGTIMIGAPTFVKAITKAAKPEQLKSMRLCITGAEKMPPELEQAIKQLGKADGLLEGYGITECAPVLTFTPQGKPRKGVGQPLPGVEIKIIDLNTHQLKASGESGMIIVRGPNIFSGYLNPGQASPFIEFEGKQWYVTGDLGYFEDGNLILSGRLKRFVKIGGEMVSLAAIEEALLHTALKKGWTTGTEDAPVLAVTGKEAEERPKITLYTLLPITIDDANQALRGAGFSNLVKITGLKQLGEIPVMGTGKVHYRKLEEEAS